MSEIDEVTYPSEFVGTTLGPTGGVEPAPAGYRRVRESVKVGDGQQAFDLAAHALMTWQVHRRAGLRVTASADEAAIGVDVASRLGFGWFAISAPCVVVAVVSEPDRVGFAYGTLRGHPESGEESFVVELRGGPDGNLDVWFHVTAFSKPATWWSRLGAPVARRVQDTVTRRYLKALIDP